MTSSGNRRPFESLAFLFAGMLCIELSREKSSAAALTSVLHPSAAVLHQLLFLYGILLLVLSLASYIVGRGGRSLTGLIAADCAAAIRRPEEAGRRPQSPRRSELLWLAGALCIGAIVRGYFLRQPMRYDESYSFVNFVYSSYHDLFLYPTPNNHVLNSIMEKLSCWLIGPTPVGIRLPAFLCGVGLIPLSFALCRKLAPGSSGILAAYGVAMSPYLILFADSGRGYSMLLLVLLQILHVSLDEAGTGVTGRWALPALLSALGMLIVPSAAYGLAGFCLWITAAFALQAGSLFKAVTAFLIPYGALTAMLTLVVYTPTIWVTGGIGAVTANGDFVRLPAHQFAVGILPHLVETIHDFARDVPLFATVLLIALALAGTYAGIRERNRALALLLPAFLLAALLLFVLKKSIPPPRVWAYMIPLWLICADAGYAFLSRSLPRVFWTAAPAVISLAAIGLVWRLMAHNAILAYPDTGVFPAAAAIAGYLSPVVSQGDVLCAEVPAGAELAYYLWRDVTPEQFRARPGGNRKFFVHPGSPLPEASWDGANVTILLRSAGFVLYDWTELGARHDWTDFAGRPEVLHRATCYSPAELSSTLGLQ